MKDSGGNFPFLGEIFEVFFWLALVGVIAIMGGCCYLIYKVAM